MEWKMVDLLLAKNEAQIETNTRRLLFIELTAMGIDVTSDIGLHVIDNFRIEDGQYTEDDIYYIERMSL